MKEYIFDKDCNHQLTLPTIISNVSRIIAIGDVHGDMKLVIECLEISKVILQIKNMRNIKNKISVVVNNEKQYYDWIGNDAVVVQIGDQNDSCRPSNNTCNDPVADDINILNFFTELHQLALAHGGGVYSLIGNHEIMNIEGNFEYTSNADIQMFKNYKDPYTNKIIRDPEEARKHAFSNGNQYANFMGCTRQSAIIINDFLFIHGGVSIDFLKNFRGRDKLYELNTIVKKWLLDTLQNNSHQIIMNQILNDTQYSPFWTRVLGSLPTHLPFNHEKCKTLLDPVLESYKIKGMVIGHTPQIQDGINSTCGEKLFRIDVGASKAFNDSSREPQILEILKLRDGTYKYTVIFLKNESYSVHVDDDNNAFKRIETRLPN